MKIYTNEEVMVTGCPGCAYAKGEFSLPCGIAFENEKFNLSQDWELPIEGFMILSPKKCVEKFSELEKEEKIEMFDIVDKTIKVLREHKICDRFDVVFEEKENRHFHVWIMPRHDWMKKIDSSIIGSINEIFEYAKSNFRNEETYNKIKEITGILQKNLKI